MVIHTFNTYYSRFVDDGIEPVECFVEHFDSQIELSLSSSANSANDSCIRHAMSVKNVPLRPQAMSAC